MEKKKAYVVDVGANVPFFVDFTLSGARSKKDQSIRNLSLENYKRWKKVLKVFPCTITYQVKR